MRLEICDPVRSTASIVRSGALSCSLVVKASFDRKAVTITNPMSDGNTVDTEIKVKLIPPTYLFAFAFAFLS